MAEEARISRVFLRKLTRELSILPGDQRRPVIEDVEAHLADARAAGRPIEEALAGLGTPREVAERYADELGLDKRPDPFRRAVIALGVAAIGVGILTAVLVPLSAGELARTTGWGPMILALVVPVALAALPLLLPRIAGIIASVASAVLMTVVVAVGLQVYARAVSPWGEAILYVPMVVVLWTAVIVPVLARSRVGSAGRAFLRMVGAIAVVLPVGLAVLGAMSGAVNIAAPGVAACVVVVVLGVLFAVGLRAAYVAVAVLGCVGLVWTLFEPGLLFLAIWTFGGVWLSVGVGALAGTRRPLFRAS